MPKISFEKRGIVKEIIKRISDSPALLITNHQRLTVAEVEGLREKLASVSVSYLGIKNRLFKIALRETRKGFSFNLNGQSGVCYGNSIEELARVLVGFKTKHPNFNIQGGISGNDFFSPQYIEEIAALPSKEVIIAMFLNLIQSPLTNFTYLLKEHLRRLVRVIGKIKNGGNNG